MKVLITGSTGHLGEALMRILPGLGHEALGLDIIESPLTTMVGSLAEHAFVRECMDGIEAVLHTATLHKPHVATHSMQDFVDTNITGTLNLLEESASHSIRSFVFTSTTSAFGAALSPSPSAPATWIDETVQSVPKNIYGVTKTAAEDLCELFAREHALNCIVLRTSRFFPEEDDSKAVREALSDENAKANEFLFRRVDLEDAALAHVAAMERASELSFAMYVVSATSPFTRSDLLNLRIDPSAVVTKYHPEFAEIYREAGFEMLSNIERVYVNALARHHLDWTPHYDFGRVLEQIAQSTPIGSDLSRVVGAKGYHRQGFGDFRYPLG